ncbi:hypothetical protein PIB30_080097 [Stylosanthes scabra]|uniref:Putative plant transposon protein domain-containing protein n=1 Tax=Stylosanthes scabra TaxID=79078 RepID=A0ABU6RRS0_9FABA|nr:hypothetical protein [Stylosanthes scabra]
MASKGKGVARQPSSRTHGISSRRQISQEAVRFETPTHAEMGQILSERKFMYDPAIPINVSLVREFYANRDQKNQPEVYIRGRKIPCHRREIEGVIGIPRLEGKSEHRELGDKYDIDDLDLDEVMQVIGKDGATWPSVPGRINKKILNKEAWMWMKLAVCNILLTRHETTLGVDHILLIYALMKGMMISLSEVMGMRFSMSQKHNSFSPMAWKEGREADEDPIPPPMLAPAPPAATHTDIPASFARSSPQPTRKELMRALRCNDRIMRRHEQLLLMLHPGTNISQLEQISSQEVSEHQ